MPTFFNIRYEFDPQKVHQTIANRLSCPGADYICVADGVILDHANRDNAYREIINGGMFSICDSSYVPLYIKWIYGYSFSQYCGSQIFKDIVSSRKYRMIFLGSHQSVLDGLQKSLLKYNPDVEDMKFIELPFCKVDEFDYEDIAKIIQEDKADIIWIALGAPKQELFMSKLKPHLDRGVMIAVGAAFAFYSETGIKRAPQWMVRNHLEFVHRISKEPKKQLQRCFHIVRTLPGLLFSEWKTKRRQRKENREAIEL